jgi:putative phosphoribosyl transferase
MTGETASHAIELPIPTRETAGRALAQALTHELAGYREEGVIVLALPRGGVPVAAEIARSAGVPLDLILVRKLGTPGRPELAMGAIASRGPRVLNQAAIRAYGVSDEEIDAVEQAERMELQRREQRYRDQRPPPDLEGRLVILVDDGVATGATMLAAIRAAKLNGARRVIVAVPVAPLETVRMLEGEADQVHCLATPEPFIAIGLWYRRFEQVSDEHVKRTLDSLWNPATEATAHESRA